MKKLIQKLIFAFPASFAALIFPKLVFAQVQIGPTFNSRYQTQEGIGQIVSLFLSNAGIVAGVVFLFLLIVAGYTMINGAGSGDPKKFAQGKDIIIFAFIGFLIIFAAYWIIQIIELITGLDIV